MKTGHTPRIHVVYGDVPRTLHQRALHQEGQAILMEDLIVSLWLVQSQSKGRTGSPAFGQEQSYGSLGLPFLEELGDLLTRRGGDSEH